MTLLSFSPALQAQAGRSTHSLSFNNVTESVDPTGRRVLVAAVAGDLPGVLTLALVVDANGLVTSGEWALNVSYIKLGPPDNDGDGDASESLVQRGVIKGAVTGGSAVLSAGGLASALSNVQLTVTGATMEFAGTTSGNGTAMGSSVDQRTASNGMLTVSF